MRRVTILGLMGLVLGVAVAIAALRNADDYWAGGLMLATALLIGMVTLGAVYHSGRRRAGHWASRSSPEVILPWRSSGSRSRTSRYCRPPGPLSTFIKGLRRLRHIPLSPSPAESARWRPARS